MQNKDLKERIVERAGQFEADIVCFGDVQRFEGTRVTQILPQTQTVICLGFRVLRGVYRGIEEGSTYYQYCTNGVEVMEETIMPRALLRVCALLEDEGHLALPQRRHLCIMESTDGHNFEVHYEEIYHGRKTEVSMDFEDAAIKCGLGARSMRGTVLNEAFGPMLRWCFVLTDAKIEPTPLAEQNLCDRCMECVKACPGHAIDKEGRRDPWQCGAYYRGASRRKNPFMPEDAFSGFDNREEIMDGSARLSAQESKKVMENCYFYPPIKQGYAASICGRACDMACYIHLEKAGKLKKKFDKPFRLRPDWSLSVKD